MHYWAAQNVTRKAPFCSNKLNQNVTKRKSSVFGRFPEMLQSYKTSESSSLTLSCLQSLLSFSQIPFFRLQTIQARLSRPCYHPFWVSMLTGVTVLTLEMKVTDSVSTFFSRWSWGKLREYNISPEHSSDMPPAFALSEKKPNNTARKHGAGGVYRRAECVYTTNTSLIPGLPGMRASKLPSYEVHSSVSACRHVKHAVCEV